MASPKPDREDPWALHFTPLENLAGILNEGLLADNRRPSDIRECGQPSIKQNRRSRKVPLEPYGVVADYVPFYFAERSPMLSSIVSGRVPTYTGAESELIYLVTRVSMIERHGRPWVATNRNAVLKPAKFTADRSKLASHVDWEVMEAQQWANTPEDGSRRERRMAELLVHEYVPWSAFLCVAVCCHGRVGGVAKVIEGSAHRPKVVVRPHWYFGVPHACVCQAGRGSFGRGAVR